MLRTCKQCGKTFNLTQSEIDFYNGKGLQLPKRCESCRNANKKKNSSKQQDYQVRYQPEKSSSSKSTSVPIKMIILLIILVVYGLVQLVTYTNNTDTNSSSSVEYSSISQTVTTSQQNAIDNTSNTELVTTIQDTSATQDITTVEETTTILETTSIEDGYVRYYFRNNDRLIQHYEKHGIEMGFASAEDYEKSASDVLNNPNSLHKLEAEDNDDVYYLESTGEFVILSTDGYIRTYYYADLDYFNRQ